MESSKFKGYTNPITQELQFHLKQNKIMRAIRFTVLIAIQFVSSLLTDGATASLVVPGDIIVADQNSGIIRINPMNGAQTLLASGGYLTAPRGVVFDGDGSLIVANATGRSDGTIIRINQFTGQQTLISQGGFFGNLTHPVFDRNGKILVTVFDLETVSDHTGVVRVDPATGAQELVSSGGSFNSLTGIVADDTGRIFVSDSGLVASGAAGPPAAIFEVDESNGQQSTISSDDNFFLTHGVVLHLGDLYVTDHDPNNQIHGDAIIRVDVATGNQTIVSTGGYLDGPFGIATDANGKLIVTNIDSGDIVGIDPLTGLQDLISSGGLLSGPAGVAIAPSVVPEPSALTLLSCLVVSALIGHQVTHVRRHLHKKIVQPLFCK